MKIARFKDHGYNVEIILAAPAASSTYVRISEWVDVDFPPRDPDEIRADMHQMESAIRAEHAGKLARALKSLGATP